MYRTDRPLRGFDEEIRTFIAGQFEEEDLNLHPGYTPKEIKRSVNGKLDLIAESKSGDLMNISGTNQIFMATGRKLNVAGLDLEATGVDLTDKR